MTDAAQQFDDIKKTLRSILLTTKEGIPLKYINKEYKEYENQSIPYRAVGYHSLEEMLENMPDAVRLDYRSGDAILFGVANEETAHIARMVSAQRGKKRKPAKPQRSYYGSYSSRPRGYSRPVYKPRPTPIRTVPSDIQQKIQMLMQENANGIALMNFHTLFHRRFGHSISLSNRGFHSISEVLSALPNIVTRRQINGDIFLFPTASHNQGVPYTMYSAQPAHRTTASTQHYYQPPHRNIPLQQPQQPIRTPSTYETVRYPGVTQPPPLLMTPQPSHSLHYTTVTTTQTTNVSVSYTNTSAMNFTVNRTTTQTTVTYTIPNQPQSTFYTHVSNYVNPMVSRHTSNQTYIPQGVTKTSTKLPNYSITVNNQNKVTENVNDRVVTLDKPISSSEFAYTGKVDVSSLGKFGAEYTSPNTKSQSNKDWQFDEDFTQPHKRTVRLSPRKSPAKTPKASSSNRDDYTSSSRRSWPGNYSPKPDYDVGESKLRLDDGLGSSEDDDDYMPRVDTNRIEGSVEYFPSEKFTSNHTDRKVTDGFVMDNPAVMNDLNRGADKDTVSQATGHSDLSNIRDENVTTEDLSNDKNLSVSDLVELLKKQSPVRAPQESLKHDLTRLSRENLDANKLNSIEGLESAELTKNHPSLFESSGDGVKTSLRLSEKSTSVHNNANIVPLTVKAPDSSEKSTESQSLSIPTNPLPVLTDSSQTIEKFPASVTTRALSNASQTIEKSPASATTRELSNASQTIEKSPASATTRALSITPEDQPIQGGSQGQSSSKASARRSLDLEYATDDEIDIQSNISVDMQRKLLQLLIQHPDGIYTRDLPDAFQELYRRPLDYQKYGFHSVINIAQSLDRFISIERPNKSGDWILYHRRTHVPIQEPSIQEENHEARISDEIRDNMYQVISKYSCGITVEDLKDIYLNDHGVELEMTVAEIKKAVCCDLSDYFTIAYSRDGSRQALITCANAMEDEEDNFTPIDAAMEDEEDNFTPIDAAMEDEEDNFTPIDAVSKHSSYTFVSPPNLDTEFQCYICVIESPESMYIQLYGEDKSTALNKLMENLCYYNQPGSEMYKLPTSMIDVGQVCAARFYMDTNWHRVMITDIISATSVMVNYVDYGSRCEVDSRTLRLLKEEYFKLPAQAIRARLHNLKPVIRGEWGIESRDRVLELCSNFEMNATCVSITDGKLSLVVSKTDSPAFSGLSLNDILINEGFALADGSPMDGNQTDTVRRKKRNVQKVQVTPYYEMHLIVFMNKPNLMSSDISATLWASDQLLERLEHHSITTAKNVVKRSVNPAIFTELEQLDAFHGGSIPDTLYLFEITNVITILNALNHPSSNLKNALIQLNKNFDLTDPSWLIEESAAESIPDPNLTQLEAYIQTNATSTIQLTNSALQSFSDTYQGTLQQPYIGAYQEPTLSPLGAYQDPTLALGAYEAPTVPLGGYQDPTLPSLLETYSDPTLQLGAYSDPTLPLGAYQDPTLPSLLETYSDPTQPVYLDLPDASQPAYQESDPLNTSFPESVSPESSGQLSPIDYSSFSLESLRMVLNNFRYKRNKLYGIIAEDDSKLDYFDDITQTETDIAKVSKEIERREANQPTEAPAAPQKPTMEVTPTMQVNHNSLANLSESSGSYHTASGYQADYGQNAADDLILKALLYQQIQQQTAPVAQASANNPLQQFTQLFNQQPYQNTAQQSLFQQTLGNVGQNLGQQNLGQQNLGQQNLGQQNLGQQNLGQQNLGQQQMNQQSYFSVLQQLQNLGFQQGNTQQQSANIGNYQPQQPTGLYNQTIQTSPQYVDFTQQQNQQFNLVNIPPNVPTNVGQSSTNFAQSSTNMYTPQGPQYQPQNPTQRSNLVNEMKNLTVQKNIATVDNVTILPQTLPQTVPQNPLANLVESPAVTDRNSVGAAESSLAIDDNEMKRLMEHLMPELMEDDVMSIVD